MPALLSWVLLLGGIATTVAAAALAAEVDVEVALALVGLLATLVGAAGLLLSRVAGDTPSALRPPGATGRVNAPTGGAPTAPRRQGRGRSRGRGSAALIATQGLPPSSAVPKRQALPTGPSSRGVVRTPLLVAAFIVGAAWNLTLAADGSGPLDVLAELLVLATPIAAAVAIATRLIGGRAWSPAVTVASVGAAVVLGNVAAGLAFDLLG